ncbi:amidohydrolase [Bacillus horti]|uniref:5-methylthioadenosine/S-adenosylhomocysteine deaminase n=1 Tax=Caldalkalibacillus horti TaxID=77523 RepID=A0ABT9VWY9_9BACI|nr:amidohydrolase [Bacillus horti]MDQ0165508.1 5-methylthioadenosine/S-adenosylhomocysteine deaminase [Bacillus horti]
MKTRFENGVIITGNKQNAWFKQGYMVIEDNKIVEIGDAEIEVGSSNAQYDQIIDLKGRWVMPGWVNTHGHAAMSLLRGYADDLPLKEWLEQKMWPMEGQFNADTVRAGTALAVVEMLKTGTTCFLDMYDHMSTVAKVVEESGIRAVLARGVIGLCPEEEQIRKLQEATQFALEWDHQANGRITTMMSPHAPYTCPPHYIQNIIEQAAKHQLPVHIHMSETAREVQQNVDDYGKRPVAHLRDLGVFELPTLVAHAVHVNEEEMDILQQYDVKVAHNPTSNLKLGSGIAPVPSYLKRGITVSLGTDSAASNNKLDMFQEARLAALIHKGAGEDPLAVPAEEALRMGTKWGAESVFLSQVGALEVGMEADFITINPNQAHLQPAHQPISHIIYSATGQDVEDVYVQGKQIVKNKECLFLDEERIIYEANQAFQKLNQV